MKLFLKGDRRYREAEDSEVLLAAAAIFAKLNLEDQARVTSGMALVLGAQEKDRVSRETKSLAAQKEKPL